jgi:putative salt-induced outer membrane protein YdiY
MKKTTAIGGLVALAMTGSASAALSAIGTTDQLDRARKFQALVAVPDHDDQQEWTSSFDLGASFTSGNSENLFVTASLTLDKEFGDHNEFFANITYAYGEDNDATTTEEVLLTASWKKLFDPKNYTGLRLDGRHDDLADINYRLGLSALIGHYFVRGDDTQFSVEAGLGYTWEEQGGLNTSFVNSYFGERYELWVTDYTRIFQSIAFFGPVDDFSDYRLIGELGLETYLSQDLSFKVFLQDKFENAPAMLREQNDVKVVSGISYKF